VALDKSGVLRQVNDGIAAIAADYERRVGPPGLPWGFACECGDDGCSQWVQMTLTEYAAVQRRAGSVLAPGHTGCRSDPG